MKTTPFILSLSLLLLHASAFGTPLPQGDMYLPRCAAEEAVPAAEYQGHLLPAMQDYLYYLRLHARNCLPLTSTLTTYRHAAFDVARRYPDEVNDLLQRADGSWLTPLSMAVQAQDAELVKLLLQLRALPFSPHAAHPLTELPPLPGIAPQAEVNAQLLRAMNHYNPLSMLMRGVNPQPRWSETSRLSTTMQQLEVSREHVYLGEPGEENPRRLSFAFNRIPAAGGALLRVQPLSRTIVQPGERRRGYGAIITTGRVEKALTGTAPACEYITWEIAHEGLIDERSQHPAQTDTPVFLPLYASVLERSTLENGHLMLKGIDNFDLSYGEEMQAAFDRVLADYPERAENIAATPDELAAARQLLEETPIVLRADIVSHGIKLDEQAGQVQVRYLATPRDPLRGALIKGTLRDWGNIIYYRSFPISDAWRQRHADYRAGKARAPIPVILCLAPAEKAEEGDGWVARTPRQPITVLRAMDSENDAPLFRALNQAAFFPGRP